MQHLSSCHHAKHPIAHDLPSTPQKDSAPLWMVLQYHARHCKPTNTISWLQQINHLFILFEDTLTICINYLTSMHQHGFMWCDYMTSNLLQHISNSIILIVWSTIWHPYISTDSWCDYITSNFVRHISNSLIILNKMIILHLYISINPCLLASLICTSRVKINDICNIDTGALPKSNIGRKTTYKIFKFWALSLIQNTSVHISPQKLEI